jgi:hypothetical protein
MSSYTKSTDFASKDALLTGNPLKVVKGTEIDDEFNSIQTAVNSKADTNSPDLTGTPTAPTAATATNTTQIASTAFVQSQKASPVFTGTPTAPTASFGTDTTQLATTAFVQAALEALYPVGTIYTSVSATNPASTFGFGTWVAFGAGRVPVGQDTGDAAFNTLEETGGSADATLPSHTHTFSDSFTTAGAGGHSHSVSDPGHFHQMVGPNGSFNDGLSPATGTGTYGGGTPDDSSEKYNTYSKTTGISIGSVSNHTHTGSVSGTTSSSGSSATDANLQPYIVVKMWKRTA